MCKETTANEVAKGNPDTGVGLRKCLPRPKPSLQTIAFLEFLGAQCQGPFHLSWSVGTVFSITSFILHSLWVLGGFQDT